MTQDDLIGLMFRASQAEVGILLSVSDVGRALRAFARAREAASAGEAEEHVALPPVRFRALEGHPEGNLVILSGRAAEATGAKPVQEEELW